jgi:DHA1 family inner membrane transport protein
LTLIVVLALTLLAPSEYNQVSVSVTDELSAFTKLGVWVYTLLALLFFTVHFEIYWNVRVWMTELGGFDGGVYSVFLIILGIGMVLGSQIGGVLADRSDKLAIAVPVLSLVVGFALTVLLINQGWLFLIGVFFIGIAVQISCSPIIVHSMRFARIAPMMSASMFQIGACSGVFVATYAYQFVNSTWGESLYNPLYIDAVLLPLLIIVAVWALFCLRRTKTYS